MGSHSVMPSTRPRTVSYTHLIVYTSGDSVLQIAAHEDVIPLDELYRICEYARTLINGPEITMGRVIARPYVCLLYTSRCV